MGETPDPLALGQRIVSVLETGLRTATYKLATLVALVDHCVENLPRDPGDALDVPVRDLALRVVELYWPQVRAFDNRPLNQSTQSRARIPSAVRSLREAAGAGESGMSFAVAAMKVPAALDRALDEVALTLVQQPVHRLQKLPNGDGEPFLYDDSWMHDQVSRRTVAQHGGVITLFPGVAFGLARLSGLLRPALELLWVEDVRRMNRWLDADSPDVAGHLFGRDRISLAPARQALTEAFGPTCFYCGTRTGGSDPVDHVLPWSRVGIDGLANLVPACPRCNGDKRHALPAVSLVDQALARDRVLLEQAAEAIGWPTQYDRVVSVARGLFRGEPQGSATWAGYRTSRRLDLAHLPVWLEVD